MKQSIRKFKRGKGWARYLYILVIIAYIISYAFFAKSIISLTGIETALRYILLVIFVLIFLLYVFVNFTKICQKKYMHVLISSIIMIIMVVFFSFSAKVIDFLYNKISSLSGNDRLNYKTSLIVLNDTKFDDSLTLGMIEDENDYEGYTLANKLIKKHNITNKIKTYDNYFDMLYDLYERKIGGVFISGSYVTIYSTEADFSNIGMDTKVVYDISEKKEGDNSLLITSSKTLDEPFTILILGVDSEDDGLDANAAFNGDTLILATFNPNTLNATLFSIPRDTYVPIVCRNNAYSKINSSAAYGTECVTSTIENLTGIDIDYFVKINFKGVVDLVDALDGIEVDVEEPDFRYNHGYDCNGKVCEQNSDRLWGKYTIFIDPGISILNGEQALAYARCRGLYAISDLARNKHQQDVILAITKKIATINNYSQFEKILNTVSKNISTNMSTDQILSSYKIIKKMLGNMLNDEDFINIQKTYLEVYNMNVYISSGRVSSALGYYDASLQDIIKTMNINLGNEDATLIKTFSYSINETYEPIIAGKGLTEGITNSTLPSFISQSREAAKNYCDENNIDCSFTYIDENSQYYSEDIAEDLITYQSVSAGTLVRNINSIDFYIKGASVLLD
ncbi:MAG: LCP family protein [Bacilli bacterium]